MEEGRGLSGEHRIAVGLVSLAVLVGGLIWLFSGLVAGNPGGIEGPGFLKSGIDCPVELDNYALGVTGIVGGALTLLVAVWGIGIAIAVNFDGTSRRWVQAVVVLIVMAALWATLLSGTHGCPT